MINEKSTKIPCWLVWSVGKTGSVTLEGVFLINSYAVATRKFLLEDKSDTLIKVIIEPGLVNHPYSPGIDELLLKYMPEAMERFENIQMDSFRKEFELAIKHGFEIFDAAGTHDWDAVTKACSYWITLYGHIRMNDE